jgi:HNH endonuclease
MKASCLHCNKEFKFTPSQKRGLYCSSVCQGTHKSLLHKNEWYNGNLHRIERITLRRYLSEDRGYKCEVCGVSEWQNKPITLHVDHVNGDPSNNSPSNVRLICPNCHSQTQFLGAANKGRGRGSLGLPKH